VRQPGGRVRTVRAHRRRRDLLGELRPLDDGLDVFLLILPVLIIAPPHWSLVFAVETQVFASLAGGLAFIALLSSQSTCEAT